MKKITLFSVLMVLLCFITGILGACSGKGDHNESSDNGTRIQMSFDGQTIYGTLNDNSVSRDLISRLPLTLEFSDYSGTEKIAYLPDGSADWDMSDAPTSCTPSAGDIAMYSPWGNLSVFYRDFRWSEGLVPLGRLDEGEIDKLAVMSGSFRVTISLAEDVPPLNTETYYTVTFDSQGGSAIESQRILSGNPVHRPLLSTREGYVLLGWYKDAEATENWDFDTDRVTSDITLYAGWEEENHNEPTASLVYERQGDSYIITDVGDETVIVIPAEHNGLPVTAIRGQNGTGAFARKDIVSVLIPDTITEIGQNTFNNCSKLVSITIGENSALQIIGNNAFSGCSSLKQIYIPSGVTQIGTNAFNNCGALENILVAKNNIVYRSENGHLIERSTNVLIRGGHNAVVPDGVKSIAQAAFRRTNGIEQLYIPTTVTEIGNYFIADSSITTVLYQGTEQEWNAIIKTDMWNYGNRDVSLSFSKTEPEPDNSKVLVVYFSYSGNTENIAKLLADCSGGTLVEIIPEIPYTAADVNYNNSSSRCQVERRTDARPAISNVTYNQITMAEYDTVLIGYPIWNGGEPMIIRTFIEHYDNLDGKTVYTFSTSASSSGSAAFNSIRNRCQEAAVTDYLHFTSSTLQNAESIVQSTLESWKLTKEEEMQTMRMRMSFNGETVFVTLNDNSATQDLIARLQIAPVTLLFHDFGGSEKIGYPEPALDVSDVSGCDPDVGDLTIYKPWGNLAAFYRDTAGYSDSLVPIGKIENGGIELLAAQSGEFSVTLAIA